MEKYSEEFQIRCAGSARYNTDNIQFLEEYVKVQCENNGYDLDANLTLLKLYQLNPNYFSDAIVTRILLLCLKALPKPHTVLAKCLIDSNRIGDSDKSKLINNVCELSNLLETCSFKEAWEKMEMLSDYVDTVAGFRDSVRDYVISVVEITFQNVDVALLRQLLGKPSEQSFEQIVKGRGWKLEGDNAFITNHEATIKSKSIQEKIEMSDMLGIIREALG